MEEKLMEILIWWYNFNVTVMPYLYTGVSIVLVFYIGAAIAAYWDVLKDLFHKS